MGKSSQLPHCDRQTELEDIVLHFFLVLTKESLRVYILFTLSEVREWKKTSCMFILFKEASRSRSYSEDTFVVSNAKRRADNFFTNATSSDTIASDLLD
jgi:hypothetical protein